MVALRKGDIVKSSTGQVFQKATKLVMTDKTDDSLLNFLLSVMDRAQGFL